MGLTNMLKGISNEFEVTRVMGAVGGAAYIICANGFVAWDCLHNGKSFDVTAYCLAFPGGMAALLGATATAAGYKEGKIADARATQAQTEQAQ